MIEWPDGKDFAFTVIDDTDNATISNIKPVYDLLDDLNIRTTKTVWVYPPRDDFTGQALINEDYLYFIKNIQDKGFEIAFHNVGSGEFDRKEIIRGLQLFKELVDCYPSIQINHASNPDNIYWGYDRYVFPVKNLMKIIFGDRRHYFGNNPDSMYFWGDYSKKYIKFIRNHCFNGINTVSYDPMMPYFVDAKKKYSNYWFSSSDGDTVEEFTDLISYSNVEKLEKQNGACIVYTHFAKGFIDPSGRVDKEFEKRIRSLAGKNGWFVPARDMLEFILKNQIKTNANYPYLLKLDVLWIIDRIIKKIKYKR